MHAPKKALHIDIPVKLSEAELVFSIGALQFEGDLPASIFHMQLIKNDIADWGATSEIVAVFHTNAGHVTLHDSAYNADRSIATGNPYKYLISALQKRGVKVTPPTQDTSACRVPAHERDIRLQEKKTVSVDIAGDSRKRNCPQPLHPPVGPVQGDHIAPPFESKVFGSN